MKKNVAKLLVVSGLFLLIYMLYKFGFGQYLTLENLKEQSIYFRTWVKSNYLLSVSIYMLVYFIIISCSIPSVAPLTMLGGFLYGTFYGCLYAVLAASAGATFAFLLFRSVFRGALAEKYADKLKSFKKGLKEHGAYYLLVLHFVIVVPFFIINVLAALADVSLWRFIWTTVVGFIPCALLYAFAGNQITNIKSAGDIFSWNVIVALALLILLTLLPVLFKRFKKSVGI